MLDASKNTMNQVNATYFTFPPLFSHTLTLIRTQNKQAAGTKTSKLFIESTERKKNPLCKIHCRNTIPHACAHTHRKANKYENQLETCGLSFIGRLPSSSIFFPNRKVFFMYNCGKKHNWSLHLTLAAQDSHLGS